MPAESGTGRQTYSYYDSNLEGKILQVTAHMDKVKEIGFIGNRLQFLKDPTNIYSERRLEEVGIAFYPYKNQIVGLLTGKWSKTIDSGYEVYIYEVKLFNPTKTGLADFTYYINLIVKTEGGIKDATRGTYSNEYVLLNDDGTVKGQVYKCHYDRAVQTDYFPHHDPDYPSTDCEKWDKYFGDLPWYGYNSPQLPWIMDNGFSQLRQEWSIVENLPWYGYNYKPKRSIDPFYRHPNQKYDAAGAYNEVGNTILYLGQTSTTFNVGEFRVPWMGTKIRNYGYCVSTSPNPTRDSEIVFDRLLSIIEMSGTDTGVAKYYSPAFYPNLFNSDQWATGLQPNTNYYLRIWEEVWGDATKGENPNQLYTRYSSQGIFATTDVVTNPQIGIAYKPFAITPNSVSFYPIFIQRGDGNIEWGVCYREGLTTPTIADKTVVITGHELNNVVTMTGCLPGRQYTFLPYAIRNKGQSNQEVFYCNPLQAGNYIPAGSAKNNVFTTSTGAVTLATVVLDTPLSKNSTTVTLAYKLTSNGNEKIEDSNVGICYGKNPNPTISDSKIYEPHPIGEFAYRYVTITELEPETKYYFRAFVTNSKGTSYNNTQVEIQTNDFKTPDEVFTLYEVAAQTITKDSAKVFFDINAFNSVFTSETGICFSKNQRPTTSDSKITVDATLGTKNITLSDLSSNTTYFARAYYIDGTGTYYSKQISFTTLKNIVKPVVSTVGFESTLTTVKLKIKVTSDGGATTQNFIALSRIKSALSATSIPANAVSVTAGAGDFETTLNKADLIAGNYYYCGYSSNSSGISQSEIKSFTVDDVVTQSVPVLDVKLSNITASSVYFNTLISSLGNSELVSGSVKLIKISDNSIIHDWSFTTSAIDNGTINGLLPETEYKLRFTVKTQYLVDNTLPDVVGEETFTTLESVTPEERTLPNIKLSLKTKTEGNVTVTTTVENVLTGATLQLFAKKGSEPSTNYYDSSADKIVQLNNVAEQNNDLTLPSTGTWYLRVVMFDPNGSFNYCSSVLRIDTTHDDTIDPVTGLPLYPYDGQQAISAGKRFIWNESDGGWMRDYLYNPSAQIISGSGSGSSDPVQLVEIQKLSSTVEGINSELKFVKDETPKNKLNVIPQVGQIVDGFTCIGILKNDHSDVDLFDSSKNYASVWVNLDAIEKDSYSRAKEVAAAFNCDLFDTNKIPQLGVLIEPFYSIKEEIGNDIIWKYKNETGDTASIVFYHNDTWVINSFPDPDSVLLSLNPQGWIIPTRIVIEDKYQVTDYNRNNVVEIQHDELDHKYKSSISDIKVCLIDKSDSSIIKSIDVPLNNAGTIKLKDVMRVDGGLVEDIEFVVKYEYVNSLNDEKSGYEYWLDEVNVYGMTILPTDYELLIFTK